MNGINREAVLITGGAGFVGSNLAIALKHKYPNLKIIAMDSLRRRGSELNLPRLREAGIKFVHGDIRCPEDFPSVSYDSLIECSAEPSVLAGYGESPLFVINTNLVGTINCLEEARKRKADVVFLSTSRVYPYEAINRFDLVERETRLEWADNQESPGWSPSGIAEEFPLEGPRSIYGASKLCSEHILQEYIAMYGLRGVINRFGVITGPWQFGKVDQGVFTLWMLAHYFQREGLKYIGYGGQGKQVRDLLHIDDVFALIDFELNHMDRVTGEVFNAGGGREVSLSLRETTMLCREITGNHIDIGSEKVTRPADLGIYLSDNGKVFSQTGWQPQRSSQQILQDIYNWICENETALQNAL